MDANFFAEFKTKTEDRWAAEDVTNPAVYGFQFQQGTRWNPGLSPDEINQFEDAVAAQFPSDFRTMLQYMNGTDLPSLNVYGDSGEPHKTAFTLDAFPRDLPNCEETNCRHRRWS